MLSLYMIAVLPDSLTEISWHTMDQKYSINLLQDLCSSETAGEKMLI